MNKETTSKTPMMLIILIAVVFRTTGAVLTAEAPGAKSVPHLEQ
jgi:hypothetical protein